MIAGRRNLEFRIENIEYRKPERVEKLINGGGKIPRVQTSCTPYPARVQTSCTDIRDKKHNNSDSACAKQVAHPTRLETQNDKLIMI